MVGYKLSTNNGPVVGVAPGMDFTPSQGVTTPPVSDSTVPIMTKVGN